MPNPQQIKDQRTVLWMAAFLFILTLLAMLQSGCTSYNSHVVARSDSVSGYAKDEGGYGAAYTHRVEYR